ncbi:MAG: EF-P lysine aminoacylase GenX [Gammaproteobacteria bacterium]|jgi:lysyl-tRNA synthetase class 2|nr:EF-P lysine aminoacylase GenX [Gammaproteobacteria bacterium]
MDDWRPSAALDTLRLRARLLARVREFFAARGVLEVETPMLSAAATPAPHLDSFAVAYHGPHAPPSGRLYLHTSPEFPMKRLLAAGSGSIYQLCRVFRDGEAGARHNPEFTLLEWYRVGFDLPRLIDEVETLLRAVLTGLRELPQAELRSYRDLFREYAGVDGLAAGAAELRACLERYGHRPPPGMPDDDPDPWRDLLLTHVIEPQLRGLVFVSGYPASQASLARIEAGDPPVAARFECYLDGVELANGFYELGDAAEQRRRFEAENAARAAAGRPTLPPDERLLAALEAGLPDCSGVALGFDRLVMHAVGAERIDAVLAFGIARA